MKSDLNYSLTKESSYKYPQNEKEKNERKNDKDRKNRRNSTVHTLMRQDIVT
jgi:hypothetical protein